MSKLGRPAKYHRLPDGAEVFGLHRRKDDTFYTHTDDGGKKYFGKDEARALFLFQQHKSNQQPATVAIQKRPPMAVPPEALAELDEAGKETLTDLVAWVNENTGLTKVAEAGFWETTRKLYWQNPKAFMLRLGVAPVASTRLEELGERVLEDKRALGVNPEHVASLERFWSEFCRIVAVRTIEDLDHDAFQRYSLAIRNTYTTHSIVNRFKAVRNVIRAGHDIRLVPDTTLARLTVDMKRPLRTSKKDKPVGRKREISADEFAKLLDACNGAYDRAFLLLGANGAFYEVDFAIPWTAIDLEAGTVQYDRKKTETYRSCVLWPSTVKALRALHKCTRNSPYAFATENGTAPKRRGLYERFQRILRRAKLDKSGIRPEDLRNTSATIASGVSWKQFQILMGRALPGAEDSYVSRAPKYTAEVCEALRKHYGVE